MKLTKLLPIVALTGVTGVVAPITACSCGNFEATTKWTEFEYKFPIPTGGLGFVSKAKLNMKQGQKYVMSLNLDSGKLPIGGDVIDIGIRNDDEQYYDFTESATSTLKIDNQVADVEYVSAHGELYGVKVFEKTHIVKKDFYFEFNCVSDFENATAYIILTS